MDHLPLPVESVVSEPMRVPYYGGIFDDGPWSDFPTRQGWDLDALLRGDIGHHTVPDFTEFIQTWLYLGFLCVITREEFATIASRFVTPRNDADGSFITTVKLADSLAHLEAVEDEEQREAICTVTCGAVDRLRDVERVHNLPNVLVLSMDLLYEAVQGVVLNVFLATDQSTNFLLHQNMLLGDCIALTSALERFGISGLYLRYLLGPSKSEHNHAGCTEEQCIAHTNLESQYRTTPAKTCPQIPLCCQSSNSGCQMIGVESDALSRILFSGSFPLMSISVENRTPRLSVRPFEAGIRYVAISHV